MSLLYLIGTPILIPFIVGIYKYKDIKDLKWLFYFVCYGVANEFVTLLLISGGARNTMPKSHLYTLVSFVLLFLFYQSVFKKFIKRKWFLAIIVFYMVFCFTNLLFFQSIYKYPSLPLSVLAIIMVSFSIIYFYKIMIEAKIINLSKEPLIWINTGILIYYTGNLFYYILFNLFLNYSHEYLRSIGVYFFTLNTLFYVLIAVGFYLNKDGQGKKLDKPQKNITSLNS